MTRRRSRPWRDNAEAMTMAVVMALLLKCFIVEAYKIPTGSMQPTLIGDAHAGIQDRILVDKLTYCFRDPERWDVAVFRYPLNRAHNFVKRIVGIGPEELRIEHGDLWHRADSSEPWTHLRRPRAVEDEHWKTLPPLATDGSAWSVLGGAGWTSGDDFVEAVGPGRAGFRTDRRSIRSEYLDGYPDEVRQRITNEPVRMHDVGDLRLSGVVTARAGLEEVRFELREGLRHYSFVVPGPGAADDARPEIRVEADGAIGYPGAERPATRAERAFRLPADVPTHFRAQNLDDVLTLELEGADALELAIAVAEEGQQTSAVRLEVAGEGARFEDLRVARDIYYYADARTRYPIPAGSYFMLGDNTQNSSDSREWRLERFRVSLDAAPGPVDDELALPGTRILRSDSSLPRMEHRGPGGFTRIVIDEFGERYELAADDVRTLTPLDEAPFVPREMILGRALAVFWPLNPFSGVVRLEWVH